LCMVINDCCDVTLAETVFRNVPRQCDLFVKVVSPASAKNRDVSPLGSSVNT